MSRAKRIIYEGAVYHVCLRGNNKEYIFKNSKHKSFLLKQIKEYNMVFDFELLAYVIMDNHYHLLIKTNKCAIDKIMFNINNVLSKYLCRVLKRTGHVFEKRYTCKLVTTDAQLIWLLRYIHRNPIRAGMCSNLDDYRWSSHYFYKRGFNSIVNTNFILSILSLQKTAAQMQYLNLVNMDGNDTNPNADFEAIQLKHKLSNEALANEDQENCINLPLPQKQRKTLNEILSYINIDPESEKLLLSGSKKRSLTIFKLKLIKDALENKYTLKEIGSFLNINDSSICMLLSRHNISM